MSAVWRPVKFVKLAGMVYRDVNIALVDELATFAEVVGLDFGRSWKLPIPTVKRDSCGRASGSGTTAVEGRWMRRHGCRATALTLSSVCPGQGIGSQGQ